MNHKINTRILEATPSGSAKPVFENRTDKMNVRATPQARAHTLRMLLKEANDIICKAKRCIPKQYWDIRNELERCRVRAMTLVDLTIHNYIKDKEETHRELIEILTTMVSIIQIGFMERFFSAKQAAAAKGKFDIARKCADAMFLKGRDYKGDKFWTPAKFKIDKERFQLYVQQGDIYELKDKVSRIQATLTRMPVE